MSLPPEMTAVVFDRANEFAVRTVPTPMPAPGHVLVQVAASMVCATDRKILEGKFSGTTFPHVPGHEFSGEIVELGAGVAGPPMGARVGVEVHVGCGSCDRCREGLYNLCLNYGKRETGHAHIATRRPIPPEPTDAMMSPGSMPARFAECSAIDAVSQRAPTSNGIASGILNTLLIVWTTYSAYAPWV